MSVFDNFGKKVSGIGQQTVAKAKEWSDVTKLNSQISDEQKKIDECYKTIGKLYVSKHAHDCESEFSAAVAAIMESNAKIDDYRKQIQTAKGIRTCPQCGAELPAGTLFCSTCGCRLPEIEVIPDNMVKCQKCGAVVSKDMRFCTNCGNPMPVVASTSIPGSVPQPESQGQSCSVCGAIVPDGYAFCTNCGTPVTAQAQEEPAPVSEPEPEPSIPEEEPQAEEAPASAEPVSVEQVPAEPVQEEPVPEETTPEEPAVAVSEESTPAEKICPVCGAVIVDEGSFCTSCGARLSEAPKPESVSEKPEVHEEESPSGKICLYCGAEVPSDFAFCTSCGRPMRQSATKPEQQ